MIMKQITYDDITSTIFEAHAFPSCMLAVPAIKIISRIMKLVWNFAKIVSETPDIALSMSFTSTKICTA